QAEDGIRDRNVTGVQTCALPICSDSNQELYKFRIESELVLVNVVARDKQGKPVTDLKREDFTLLEDGKPQRVSSFDFENLDTARSEERRVGKECRARGWRVQGRE